MFGVRNPVRYILWTREEYDDLGNILGTKRFIQFLGAKKGETMKLPAWFAKMLEERGFVRILTPEEFEQKQQQEAELYQKLNGGEENDR